MGTISPEVTPKGGTTAAKAPRSPNDFGELKTRKGTNYVEKGKPSKPSKNGTASRTKGTSLFQ